MKTKRLRVFAGPNGSGKSSLYKYLVGIQAFHTPYYINADEIAKNLPVSVDTSNVPISFTRDELAVFIAGSSLQKRGEDPFIDHLNVHDGVISLVDPNYTGTTYLAAALAEFFRFKMTGSESSFVYESVFSHPSKVDEIQAAKEAGFKTYLYVGATESPTINIGRVAARVELGGHGVPDEKIIERYEKSMTNMAKALSIVDKAFFFDNSTNITATATFPLIAE
jgi:predicted ABC-type ATPase